MTPNNPRILKAFSPGHKNGRFLPTIRKLENGYGFAFPYPERMDLYRIAKSIPGSVFNFDRKYWHFPNFPEANHPLFTSLSREKFKIDPGILPSHFGLWNDLKKEIRNRNYTKRTWETYLYWNQDFLKFALCLPDFVEEEDIFRYQDHVWKERNVRSRTMAALQSSLVFYYKTVRRQFPHLHFPSFKKEKTLPEILNEEEVKRLINAPRSPKHQLILAIAYSAGLRVSEVVKVQLSDIDMERSVIQIKQSKGRKDRIVVLSSRLKTEITNFLHNRKAESKWLFPTAMNSSRHLSIRTAEKVFENAKKDCGIQKKVSFHSLRHAFATHLLEKGIDIRVIQTLLGHESVRTTQIYTHITKARILGVPSPYDDL